MLFEVLYRVIFTSFMVAIPGSMGTAAVYILFDEFRMAKKDVKSAVRALAFVLMATFQVSRYRKQLNSAVNVLAVNASLPPLPSIWCHNVPHTPHVVLNCERRRSQYKRSLFV